VAIVVATICNGFIGALIVLPMGGWGLYVSLLPGLLVGSAVNIILAALAYLGISKSGLLK
jgi:riboflavin transporter